MNDDQSPERIFQEVVRMLIEVVGEDLLLEVEPSPETTFSEDLGLESIEFVALTEKLGARYGGRVNFANFVADMEMDEIMALTIGGLVSFIQASLSNSPTPDTDQGSASGLAPQANVMQDEYDGMVGRSHG